MANYASLSLKQVKALQRFLENNLGDSIDELGADIGEADAFVLVLLKQRLTERVQEAVKEG